MFYAPWCGHCQALKPIFAIAAGILRSEGSDIRFAKVDATNNYLVTSRYGINGYPILKFLERDREALEYNGGRNKPQEILDWIKKKTGSASELLKTRQDFDKATSRRLIVVYFGNSEDDLDFMTYNELANSDDK